MLQEVEALAAQLYGSATSNEQRAEAERQLSVFSSNPEMLDQARMILEQSQQPYAQHLAATAMSKLLTANWGRFSAQQRIDMRQYAVQFLANKGPALEGFVCGGLVSLLARLTKLGWFENPTQDITKDVNQFLTVSVDHCIIGLQIYNELVSEMNINKTGLPLAIHRKKSVSFRDKSLLAIFQVAMQTLNQVVSGSYGQLAANQDAKLREQCLKLTLACLSYDFFGTSSDETTEDVGTVQVPTNWRSLIEDQNTMATLLQAYNTSAAPRSAQAMECLSQLASVRRSLFPNQETRQAFLQRVLTAVVAVLRGQQRLGEEENFHEFCRLLSRVKSNFQLGEMIKCGDVYQELIQLVAQFTVQSLQSCPFASNSVYYLLQLWSRMVTSVAYLKGEGESNLDRYVPEVMRAYIVSKLQAAQQLLRSSPDEDPMENEEQLVDQLDSASPLCRYQYDRTAEFLLGLFDPLLAKLQALATQGPVAAGGSNQVEIQVVEGELAWLVYIIGAVVGARGTSRTSEEHEQLDGDLCARVFQTIQWVEMRQPAQGAAAPSSPTLQRLELSLLYFFQYFRKAYIGEQANVSSPNLYQRLSERVGVSDNLMVMNVIVNKAMSNLKVWSRHEEIVDKSLLLFHELASGYSSSKTLSKLEVVTYTLRNHGPQQLPFLNESGNPRHRTTFYTTLTRILLMDDQGHMEFEHFMAPFAPVLQHLQAFLTSPASAGPGPARDEARGLLMGVLRDLRGVCVGTPNRRAYIAFFDWLYPDYLPMFVRAAEIWWNDSAVTTPLLKFVAELVHNKCQRIAFDCSSPNGILLFREASRLLVTYGQHILTGAPPTYKDKYKGVSVCLLILSRALSGGYCNLGVFQLYGDSALSEALNIVLQLSLSIPVGELMAYPKVMRGYFPLQEILCHNHMSYLCMLESPVFIQIVSNIQYGLKWVNPPHDISVSSECASALYHIVEFRFRGSKKEGQALAALQSHIEASPQMFGQLLALLLETVVYDDCPNQWALSRPMLGLILTNEEAYEQIKRQMIEALLPDRRGQMEAAFDKLMTGVQRNLESRNRDKFTQNLTAFRQEVKAFLNA